MSYRSQDVAHTISILTNMPVCEPLLLSEDLCQYSRCQLFGSSSDNLNSGSYGGGSGFMDPGLSLDTQQNSTMVPNANDDGTE